MIQETYTNTPRSFGIGDLVKPKEPNDLESIIAYEDVVVGTFVKLKFAENKYYVENLKIGDKVSSIYGMVVNDVKNVGNITVEMFGMKDVRLVKESQVALIARISSKLSVVPLIIAADNLSDIYNEAIYVMTDDKKPGVICIANAAPANSVKLPKTMFRLRASNNSITEAYLEVAQQIAEQADI